MRRLSAPHPCGAASGTSAEARFICRRCGVVAHADRNASRNIAARGEAAWIAGRESRVPATP
ncbi:zinc ribbon domain-containing protein [Streptomyces mirabilis]|uniref:zinc ribbon domain-containing protein n=1 Tax=Streptomyces mirabilis TaxID=68239 RepID=UPI003320E538